MTLRLRAAQAETRKVLGGPRCSAAAAACWCRGAHLGGRRRQASGSDREPPHGRAGACVAGHTGPLLQLTARGELVLAKPCATRRGARFIDLVSPVGPFPTCLNSLPRTRSDWGGTQFSLAKDSSYQNLTREPNGRSCEHSLANANA